MTSFNRHRMRLIDEQSFQFPLRSTKNASIFSLADCEGLLTADNGPWQIDHLQRLREELNKCKAQVGTFPLSEWEAHTEKTEISSNIKRVITNRFTIKPPIMTRAWIKVCALANSNQWKTNLLPIQFYDIMGTFPLFCSTDDTTIRSLFLCEGEWCQLAHFLATFHFYLLQLQGLLWMQQTTLFGPTFATSTLNGLPPHWIRITSKLTLTLLFLTISS